LLFLSTRANLLARARHRHIDKGKNLFNQKARIRPTCVTGTGAGVDSVWEQYKPEATLCEMIDAKRAARAGEVR